MVSWRKILTIIAKLIVQINPAWRECRDANVFQSGWNPFSVVSMNDYNGILLWLGWKYVSRSASCIKSAEEAGVKNIRG